MLVNNQSPVVRCQTTSDKAQGVRSKVTEKQKARDLRSEGGSIIRTSMEVTRRLETLPPGVLLSFKPFGF